jgi:hypothetical protein
LPAIPIYGKKKNFDEISAKLKKDMMHLSKQHNMFIVYGKPRKNETISICRVPGKKKMIIINH